MQFVAIAAKLNVFPIKGISRNYHEYFLLSPSNASGLSGVEDSWNVLEGVGQRVAQVGAVGLAHERRDANAEVILSDLRKKNYQMFKKLDIFLTNQLKNVGLLIRVLLKRHF